MLEAYLMFMCIYFFGMYTIGNTRIADLKGLARFGFHLGPLVTCAAAYSWFDNNQSPYAILFIVAGIIVFSYAVIEAYLDLRKAQTKRSVQ